LSITHSIGFAVSVIITKFLWGSHCSGWSHQAGRGCDALGSGRQWCGEPIPHLHLITKGTKSSRFLWRNYSYSNVSAKKSYLFSKF